ncbi:MAG: biotin attachment protein [Desulfonatronovibrionaceae bacterium]
MLDVKGLLDEIHREPYIEIVVKAMHTGYVDFVVRETGVRVLGWHGKWKNTPGTLLAKLRRENLEKPVYAPDKGEIIEFCAVKSGDFVQAGTPLLKIRHFLTRQEVLDIILKKALHLFNAPEKGKYYFVPAVDSKIKARGHQSVKVRDNDELFILSRMKRETIIPYQGQPGLIYTVYFTPDEVIDAGQPLIGVCPEEQLAEIQDVVNRVQAEWEERG